MAKQLRPLVRQRRGFICIAKPCPPTGNRGKSPDSEMVIPEHTTLKADTIGASSIVPVEYPATTGQQYLRQSHPQAVAAATYNNPLTHCTEAIARSDIRLPFPNDNRLKP